MADVTIKILVEATNIDLISLDECKLAMGIPSTDTSSDAQIAQLITQNSAIIMTMCNRVFARETLNESWREIGGTRLFLTHWPVAEADLVSVSMNGGALDPSTYELEERSGKISLFTPVTEPVVVNYTGGYLLPDDAPEALQQATIVLVRAGRTEAAVASVSGIRSISHKDARVMFFDANRVTSSQQAAQTMTPAMKTVEALLYHYMRFWV